MRPFLLSTVLYTLLGVSSLYGQQLSLDEIDRRSFRASGAPFDLPDAAFVRVDKPAGEVVPPSDIVLDGMWEMAEGGSEAARLSGGSWPGSVPARVPGSVHSALWEAGVIPDPYFGRNDSIAEKQSYKTWWMRREFTVDGKPNMPRLVFGGIANKCAVWLNGRRLGEHEGMFGGPEYNVGCCLKRGKNTLVVRIDPIPQEFEPKGTFFGGANTTWRKTVVFNCVYGWHYSKIPSLGIWRSVRIENRAAVALENPFVVTRDTTGRMNLCVTLRGVSAPVRGMLAASIVPDNFEGEPHYFQYRVASGLRTRQLNLSFRIDNPRLWWPNDMGGQNLYRIELTFLPDKGTPDRVETTFGIRTVEMRPFPEGPRPDLYNWTFAINGRPMFVKGTGWCTMNALMDFSREKYDRFLSVARLQHIQMMRAWGGGIPETEEFYDLCDRYGIMVIQEWPTAWDSHDTQPFPMLEETVRTNTLRLRNHPSLVMWGGGNESGNPTGSAIDMMGRYSIELDGTRPFHRGEAWGGSTHNYNCWWDDAHLNHNLNMTSRFWGEFGIASVPSVESVMRYLPEEEKGVWPPEKGGSFLHHMPIFGQVGEYDKLRQYGGYVTPGHTLDDFVDGSQLAQVIGVRTTLERARTMWPETTGALYYKMNDNYPAVSWSCVDFYGAIKPLHYFAQDAFSPLAAVVLFDRTNLSSQEVSLPLWLLDDTGLLRNRKAEVRFTVYNDRFREVVSRCFEIADGGEPVRSLGTLDLNREQSKSSVLLFVAEILSQGESLFRTFYFTNTEVRRGGLFNLPRTTLALERDGDRVTVTNTGNNPAVGVHISSEGNAHRLTVSDNYFWLMPGESRTVTVNIPEAISVSCWNREGNPYIRP